ncbi:MAG: carbonic anhydrase [Chloracidobacterium sp.]|nr:carbonic anhydrase [Chloracidobacterium validum]
MTERLPASSVNGMQEYRKLLLANKAWAQEKLEIRPDYFLRLKDTQSPAYLWIGCSDSRVPAEDITGTEPGELFVHRNVANLVIHTDINLMSVVEYAVDVLEIRHVIICGHYNCGGVKAAMSRKSYGLINKWLRHIKDVYRNYSRELESFTDPDARFRRLVELNTIEQVRNMAETSIIQKSWLKHGRPWLHGWVYDLYTGLIQELTLIRPGDLPDDIYRYEFSPELP